MAKPAKRRRADTAPLGGDGTIQIAPDARDQAIINELCQQLGYDPGVLMRMGLRWLAWLAREITNGRDVQSLNRATGRAHKVRIAEFEIRQ